MHSARERERQDRTGKGHRHVRLCIPNVSLCSKKSLRRTAAKHRRQPLNQLIKRTECQRDAAA